MLTLNYYLFNKMNNTIKNSNLYLNVLEALKNILCQNSIYNSNALSITTEPEPAVRNSINVIFPK